MSIPIDRCLNLIRIRHYRKAARKSSAVNVRFRRDDSAASAQDQYAHSTITDAQSVCYECARYALSQRKRRSCSDAETREQLLRRWISQVRRLKAAGCK
jgi:hypothetical protein